jgi:chromosomal replication initiator protein
MEDVWNQAKSRINEKVPDHNYHLWIEPIEFLDRQDQEILLGCPTVFFEKWVGRHYLSLIQQEMNKACGCSCKIRLKVSDKPRSGDRTGTDDAAEEQLFLPQLEDRHRMLTRFQRDYTFDEFVVGMCNSFAYNAALSLACSDSGINNPVYLLSKTGLGKSHLSQAVGNHILEKKRALRVCYITAEEFTNAMIRALRHDRIEAFKDKYRRQCDVLLLEDVQFLSGKRKTQDELGYTLDALLDAEKKLIFTGTHLPAEIPKMDEKLSSRLSSGIISNIDAPDFDTRVGILKKKASSKKIEVSEDVLHYLADELSENVRQLESGLIGVAAKASLLGLPIDTGLAQSVVKNIVRREKKITVGGIQKLVCKHYKLSKEELISPSRKRAIVQPRQVAMYLARQYTNESLQAIGKRFNRYHATTLHAIGVVERQMRENGPLQKQVAFLSTKVESGNI